MRVSLLVSGMVVALAVSCASLDQGPRRPASIFPGEPGVTEGGALPLDEVFTSVARNSPTDALVYQVQSYGGTTLNFALKSSSTDALSLTISGPVVDLAGNPVHASNPGLVAQVSESASPSTTVTLKVPGVYRVQIAGGDFTGKVGCAASCYRQSVAASDLIQELKSTGKLSAFTQMLETKLVTYVSDQALRTALIDQLNTALSKNDYPALNRFPAVDLADLGKIRMPLEETEHALGSSTPPTPPGKITGDLATLLGSCDTPRSLPGPISTSLPEIRYGDYNNMAMDDCQWDRSNKLSGILTSLVADNGSRVTYAGQNIQTAADLVAALIKNGHRVEMRNERTYANFLSLMIGEPNDPTSRDAKWPTWIKTGIFLRDGSELMIPMGHSQHAWIISGPLVNAQVTFYLGIYGTGFFAQTDVRPGWTGLRTLYSMSTLQGASATATILKALDLARRYYKRNLTEAMTVAKGLPADGYGYLGVCNDSTALLEKMDLNQVTEYPLVRAKSLNSPPAAPLNDGLDAVLAGLPHDCDDVPSRSNPPSADLLGRIADMIPYSLDSPQMVDEPLRASLTEFIRENPSLVSKLPTGY